MREALQVFLMNYRASPHSTTGKPPAEILFNRQFQTKLPAKKTNNTVHLNDIRMSDKLAKGKMEKHANSKVRFEPRNFVIGERVLLQKKKTNKLDALYDTEPYTIVRVQGNRITAARGKEKVTRNVSFYKRLVENIPGVEDLVDELESIQENLDSTIMPDVQEQTSSPKRYNLRRHRKPTKFLIDEM